MEREKIIEMTANNIVDEREESIYLKGFMIKNIGTLFVLCLLWTLRLIDGNRDTADLWLILVAQITFFSLYYLKVKKNKASLLASILSVTAFIMGFITVLEQYGFIQ